MENFARLEPKQRTELINAAADRKGIHPALVEKDFWVCWTLKRLFEHFWLKDRLMFKGGTSLSKAHHLLERMSEDIDLILPLDFFTEEGQPVPSDPAEVRALRHQIDERLAAVVGEDVLPHLQEALGDLCGLEQALGRDDRPTGNVLVIYQAAFDEEFLKRSILLEFGPRSAWEPNGRFTITPYVVEELKSSYSFELPTCEIPAILAERTFWEKVAILHSVACRPADKPLREGFSRHYYDVQRMAASKQLKASALLDLELLEHVVEYRSQVWPESWVDYGQVRPGTIRLIPGEEHQAQLAGDYHDKRAIIFGDLPEFSVIDPAPKVVPRVGLVL